MTVVQIELMVAYMEGKMIEIENDFEIGRHLVLHASKEDFNKAYRIVFNRDAYDVT